MDKLKQLEAKLLLSENKNLQLVKDLKSVNRLKSEQGKALERLSDKDDYPNRIKSLYDDLRVAKDLNRQLERKLRMQEKINVAS